MARKKLVTSTDEVSSVISEAVPMTLDALLMAPTSILSDDIQKDDTKVTNRKKRAQEATVAFFDLGMVDRWNLTKNLKTEFMQCVHSMRGNPDKEALLIEFLETAREVVNVRFKAQDAVLQRRRREHARSE